VKYTNKTLENIAKNSIISWSSTPAYREKTAKKILNIKFLDGEQWIYYSKNTGKFEELMPVDNVPRVTANMMLPFAESVKSRILSMNPAPVCNSLTRDWSDIMLALNYQKMLNGILNNIDFDDKKQEIVDVMLTAHGVYIQPYWNEEIKDLDFKILSDIMAYTDPIAKRFSKSRYSCFFDVKSTSSINETYKKNYTADNLSKVMGGWYLLVYKELQGLSDRAKYVAGAKVSNDLDINDATVVVNVYFNDGGKRKRAIVGNLFKNPEVLEIEDIEANMIYIPYYRNYYSKEGRSPLDSLRNVQRDMNQLMTRLKYDFSKREKMLVDELSIEFSQDTETFDMSGSEVVRFKSKIPGQAPIQWNPAPPKVMDWNVWLRMWGEVGGQSEASRGNSPTSQASGLLTEMLIDQDETKIGLAKDNLRTGLRAVFKESIKIIHKHYTEDKVVAVMGTERSWQAMSYEQFVNKNLNFDVSVNIGEQLPVSPVSRLNMVLKLAQFGLYADKENPAEALRKLAKLESYEFDDIDQHTDKQNWEIEQIIRGESNPGVALWDDQLKHIKVLVAYLNTRDYERLDRKQQQLIQAHLGQHAELAQKQVPPAPMEGVQPTPEQTTAPQGGAVNQGKQPLL
jgi:hypothetical protein